VAYTTYLILWATQHDALGPYSLAMGAFVLPLVTVTLLVLAWRHWRGGPERADA
jgi:cation:H+ antiporter